MGRLEPRIERLEQRAQARRQRRMLAATAEQYGLTPDELLDEARRFFRQSLAAQLEEIDRCTDELAAEGLDVAAIKATLIREYRPL
jgi:hypothetical protein